MMKRKTKIAILILAPLAAMFLLIPVSRWLLKRNAPPNNIATVADVLAWTGRPEWVMKHSSPTQTYYEIAKKVPTAVALLSASSGPPSYTVDVTGRFVGWSPDSGEIQTPGIDWTNTITKELIDVDRFLGQATKMTPNQAMHLRQ